MTLFAQRRQGVYAELFGASTTAGVHYDTRFSKHTRCGARVGLARTYSTSRRFFPHAPHKTTGWTFPVALNYLIGGARHNLELGIGLSYGRYTSKSDNMIKDSQSTFAFFDIGYRYQPARGLLLRLGINPGQAIDAHDSANSIEPGARRASPLYPYISIGYSF